MHLDVIFCVGPLGIDPGAAVLRLDAVNARSQPHALLAADAGGLVLHRHHAFNNCPCTQN